MNFPDKNQKKTEAETFICSSLTAASQSKCPKCRTGKMFKIRTSWFQRSAANNSCSHCGFKFEVEPGYFYMARFINYLLNITEVVIACISVYLISGSENIYHYLFTCTLITLMLNGLNFRLSRILLLYCLTPGISFCPESFKSGKSNLFPVIPADIISTQGQ